MEYTVQQVKDILEEAKEAARVRALEFFNDKLHGEDKFSCGFAWVNIYGIKGNTKAGKVLKQAGLVQDYSKAWNIWNPSGLPVQNIDTKEQGAHACAAVLKKYGFNAVAGSRLD